LNVNDPRAAQQLLNGFYPREREGCWTGKTFRVRLAAPPNAARKGAVLILRFGIPGASIERLHTIAVSGAVNGVALTPGEYTQAGDFSYSRDVPQSAFHGGDTFAEFTLDKVTPASPPENRELGLFVTTIGLEAR